MSGAHTPGPWAIRMRSAGDKEIIVEQPGDGWERLHCEVDCDDCDMKMAEANARLIAAAPDLLAACEAALEEDCGLLCADTLRAAILKTKDTSHG